MRNVVRLDRFAHLHWFLFSLEKFGKYMDIRLAVALECRKRAADGVRSRDLVLTKHTLYQAELRRHSMGNVYRLIKTFKKVYLEFR